MTRPITDRLLIGLFASLLAAGALASAYNLWIDREKLWQLADDEWNRLPSRFEAFFNDHLGARKQLTAVHARLKMRWLRSSPTPRVWVGRDEWLFYNHNADPIYHRRIDPELPAQLDFWGFDLSARRALVEETGAHYLVVFAPNKQSVHPEFLPTSHWQAGPSSLDRLLERCRRDKKLNVLDLRDPLRAAKVNGPVYLRYDSHWNQDGAYAAYAAIVRALAKWHPQLMPRPRADFDFHLDRYQGCDLAGMVGLGDRLIDHTTAMAMRLTLSHETSEPIPPTPDKLEHVSSFISEQDRPDLPRAILFMDSFGEYPALWMREHFSRLVTVGTYTFDRDLLKQERPQVVIQLIVERQIDARRTFVLGGRSK
jgi:hypothetical protein